MTAHDVAMLLLALGVLLATARGLGELAKRFKQPEVLGEILAGILLGPSVLGVIAPGLTDSLFPAQGPGAIALHGLITLGITLFLLVAGLEVDFEAMRQHGRVALSVGVWGMLIPFALGLGVAVVAPELLERELRVAPFVFALFFATAMSISALPVIARILMDLNIYRTNVGVVTIGAAFGNNLVGAIAPIASGVAVRTAEVEGLETPLIGVGVPRTAIDFDDAGEPADLIFVVLTPPSPGAVTGKLLRDLARRLKDVDLRERALATADRREFVALLNS